MADETAVHRLIDEAEADIAGLVQDLLDETGAEFADSLERADEITAARFSVASIGRMWNARIPRLMRRLLGLSGQAAEATADDVGTALPDGWDDLPGRLDSGTLPDGINDYVQATEALLRAVGESLATEATAQLAEGLNAGEDTEALRQRLLAVFSTDGSPLGPGRAQRIALSESTRAWNMSALAAARAVEGSDRALVKQWRTRGDSRVRHPHALADGQLRLLDEPFSVGGHDMQAPGDPTAPPDLTCNCRCVLKLSGRNDVNASITAASDAHTGAMIALVPTEEDARRLALEGGEPWQELHTTLLFLGEASEWSEEDQVRLVAYALDAAGALAAPVEGRIFGVNHWNPDGDSPAWVWAVGDGEQGPRFAEALEMARWAVQSTGVEHLVPAQHTPHVPHITGVYAKDEWPHKKMKKHMGPVTYDRLRVAFAGTAYDMPLEQPLYDPGWEDEVAEPVQGYEEPMVRSWSTPDPAALAFENQETGDGRIFAPDALAWSEGPWPLQYADEMLSGHEGAELAGCITTMARDAGRITGEGELYLTTGAGWEAQALLDQGAPLGVSVDLDDVAVEFVDRTGQVVTAAYESASVLRLAEGGGWRVRMRSRPVWAAQGTSLAASATVHMLYLDDDGLLPSSLVAAAGDPDVEGGAVVHTESSGDMLMRITRARVRGATLVTVPAFADARIVLAPAPEGAQPYSARTHSLSAAGVPRTVRERVVHYVRHSFSPVTATDLAQEFGMTIEAARQHLSEATRAGQLRRIDRGRYVGAQPGTEELTAAVSGDTSLPLAAEREHPWDGTAASGRVLEWATGSGGEVDAGKLAKAYLYRDPDKDGATQSAYKLGFADVVDGALTVIPQGVIAVAAVLQGARGGADIPEADMDGIRSRVATLYDRINEKYGEALTPPWEHGMTADLEASAWQALKSLPAMPASWFAEPTAEELPEGAPGVNYKDGRIFGWVARKGEPHAGFPGKRLTIESLGRIDTSHFLRQRFELDDGSTVRAGAFTMNAGHHRDGAECETASCQFDDTRTVAGVVTVGLNAGGLWFSGAAAPWLAEWDRVVFASCQPSYHMRQAKSGYELRAVLSVPVPGHSTPLMASAVAERANMALAASAAMAVPAAQASAGDDLMAAITSPQFLDALADHMAAREAARLKELAELDDLMAVTKGEIMASGEERPADSAGDDAEGA